MTDYQTQKKGVVQNAEEGRHTRWDDEEENREDKKVNDDGGSSSYESSSSLQSDEENKEGTIVPKDGLDTIQISEVDGVELVPLKNVDTLQNTQDTNSPRPPP